MNRETAKALVAVNRRFYERYAGEFDATRERPWRGWRRVLEELPEPDQGPLTVLDLGCGNGRFATYLGGSWRGAVDYLGVDGSEALLAAAAERCRHLAGARLVACELLDGGLDAVLGERRFDLVAVFGVLHHLPGQANRLTLVGQLGRHLSPRGVLALSSWQPYRRPGFERKTVDWQRYRQRRDHRLDLRQLEPGDYLLSWRGRDDPPRYCHFPDAAEIDTWIAASGLPVLDRFAADGPGGGDNLYLLLGRGSIGE